MNYRTLEITLQHAKDLSNVNLLSKMDVYVVVSIAGGDKSLRQKTKTPIDSVGSTNPTWNFPMKFTVDEAALQANRLTLDFKLMCQRALMDKEIGVVHVPMKELLDTPSNSAAADGKQFVSYQVRKPSGTPKGQLHFSFQFAQKISPSAAPPPYGAAAVPFHTDPVMAYPAGSTSAYPQYPPPAAYPPAGGKDQYPPAALYPPVGGGAPPPAGGKDQYPPAALYPPVGGGAPPPAEGKDHYPPAALYPPVGGGAPPQTAYPAAEGKDHYQQGALYPQVGSGAPPPAGYPPQSGYGGYPPPPPSGYGGYPQQGYGGYPPVGPPMQQQAPKKKNKFGMGLGAGLLGGALGGMLIGDMVSDAGDFGGGFDC